MRPSFGTDHPDVASDLNNLAQLLKATNRLAEAEPLMRRALAIDEASFGTDHPNVASDLNNLAQLLQATNRLAEAEPLMRRALAIDEPSFGKDHPRVAIRLNNLAQLLKATNRLAEAEPLDRRGLKSYLTSPPLPAIRIQTSEKGSSITTSCLPIWATPTTRPAPRLPPWRRSTGSSSIPRAQERHRRREKSGGVES